MNRKQTIISLILVPTIGAALGWAGSQYGQSLGAYPLFFFCVGIAFLLNWIAFIPAFLLQSEKFYDLIGSVTYISITAIALFFSEKIDTRSILLASLVIIWALRLGTFLFSRMLRDGKDDRFDKIKPNFLRFLNTWGIQALWVVFTSAAAIIAITSTKRVELGTLAGVGLAVWITGFLIEVIADQQKSRFKKNPANTGKFIKEGLWSRSRHPNYFGEIMLWVGVLIIAIPVLQGWQWIALISPIFVTLLLTRLSGVPMLEAKAEKKWGGQEDYEAYKAETPVLIPKL